MIPRLGDGNPEPPHSLSFLLLRLENDSPSRGRKLTSSSVVLDHLTMSLENDSPSRGRKH